MRARMTHQYVSEFAKLAQENSREKLIDAATRTIETEDEWHEITSQLVEYFEEVADSSDGEEGDVKALEAARAFRAALRDAYRRR